MGHLTEVGEVVWEEEEGWDLSRPENGWKDRRGVVGGRPQAALPTTCPHITLPNSPPPPPPALRSPGEEKGASEQEEEEEEEGTFPTSSPLAY